MKDDVLGIAHLGRVLDNSLSQMVPLTLFNTQKFGVFEYHEKLNSFEQVKIIDEENLADRVPKNFKSAYIGNEVETYLVAGGFDP